MMSTTGVHLNDVAFAVASEGGPLSVGVSIVHAESARSEQLGLPARHVARLTPRLVSADHWSILARAGQLTPLSVCEVIRAELRHRLGTGSSSGISCAVPPTFGSEALGTLLALARLEGIDICSFHDAAALAVASVGLSGTTLVLDLGLGQLSASRVEVENGESRRRAVASRRGPGLSMLHQAWLQRIAEAMVLQTRFDPLHDGASEQRLYDLLESVTATAATAASAVLELPVGSDTLRLTLTRDQFVEAAAPVYDEILAVLHELRPAGARVNILMDEALARLPGLVERIASMRSCRLFTHETGLVARAASRVRAERAADGSVPMQRGYAVGAVVAAPCELDLTPFTSGAEVSPTHALCEGRATALPKSGWLEIGREPSKDGIRLAEWLAGVSRLHCSLQIDEAGVTLIPHSAQGTWLNDERVRGRIRVRSGDKLRVGTPGIVIDLIAVGGERHGAAS